MRVLLSLPLVALIHSCANSDGPSSQRAEGIAGGNTDSVDTAIVSVVMQGSGICSGSLIAPNLVLTARHCVSYVPETSVWCEQFHGSDGAVVEPTVTMAPYAAGTFLVTTSQSLRRPRDAGPPVAHFVSRVIIPADSTGVALCGHDVAMLELADNVPSSEAVPLVPRLDLPPTPGEIYTAIGYGGTDDNGAGVGQRRILGDLTITSVGQIIATAPFRLETQAEEEWGGERGVCGGDSGGPGLSVHREVIGAVSRGGPGCTTPVYTRVDSFADLIRATAAMAAVDGDYPAPFWVEPPAPNSVAVGSPCLADTDCSDPSAQCLFPNDGAPRRLCLNINCTMCTVGYTCGMTDTTQACLPNPQSVDSGVANDSGVDAGAAMDAGLHFTPLQINVHGGCDTRPRRPNSPRFEWWAVGLLVTASFVRRRRRV